MSKFTTYISESYNELTNKVSWPTWRELQSLSLVVMVASVIIAGVIFLMDMAFSNVMELFYDLF